jgi:hypothetical protein
MISNTTLCSLAMIDCSNCGTLRNKPIGEQIRNKTKRELSEKLKREVKSNNAA